MVTMDTISIIVAINTITVKPVMRGHLKKCPLVTGTFQC